MHAAKLVGSQRVFFDVLVVVVAALGSILAMRADQRSKKRGELSEQATWQPSG